MPIEFFMEMKIPTVTHQEKKVHVVNGKPYYYDPECLSRARAMFEAYLYQRKPEQPIQGPVRLCTKWIFKASKTHPACTWKVTKPDTDNMVKLLKDCMTKVGFWKDDALVCCEMIEKMYGEKEGIYIFAEELKV